MGYIEYRNINLTYNGRTLFKDFNLTVEAGEKVLLAAQSGSGKTTLIKMLMGFVRPDSGEIIVDGLLLSPQTVNELRKKVTYVSQDADLPKGIVSEVFKEVFSFHVNRQLGYQQDQLKKWLQQFSLTADTIDKQVDDLSGGERQRLAMIMGLLLNRDIFILDEVTTGLDAGLKEKTLGQLLAIDKTMLIISHDEVFKGHTIREVKWS
ncbi:ABC transporter ATP-binding protein [Eubacteriaceae bacterium ES2]|nr:ABC transporter ATP-binding protein [Eubacteriaceae bacterium ES2]